MLPASARSRSRLGYSRRALPRRRLHIYLPAFLIALMMQIIAPIGASWATAASLSGPLGAFGGAVICHTAAAGTDSQSDRTGHQCSRRRLCAVLSGSCGHSFRHVQDRGCGNLSVLIACRLARRSPRIAEFPRRQTRPGPRSPFELLTYPKSLDRCGRLAVIDNVVDYWRAISLELVSFRCFIFALWGVYLSPRSS